MSMAAAAVDNIVANRPPLSVSFSRAPSEEDVVAATAIQAYLPNAFWIESAIGLIGTGERQLNRARPRVTDADPMSGSSDLGGVRTFPLHLGMEQLQVANRSRCLVQGVVNSASCARLAWTIKGVEHLGRFVKV